MKFFLGGVIFKIKVLKNVAGLFSGKAPAVTRLGERPASGGLTPRQMVSGGRREALSLSQYGT